MRIIAKSTLRAFWERHPNAEEPLLAWYRETEKADWESPAQVKEQYRSASFVGGNRVVFNIKGNDYRLVVKINYPYRVVYVRFVGTHAEYDKIDVRRCDMSTIRAIRTEADYRAALARIDALMDAEFGTPDGDELDVLTDLVELYEARHVPMGYPSPIEAIRFRMEQGGLSPRDLVPFLGSRAKVSEILSGKRPAHDADGARVACESRHPRRRAPPAARG